MAEQSAPPPKVFVSYSWTSDGHKQWVLELAERLVRSGIDVVLDRWHLEPGHDKYAFMERMVTDDSVERVLLVCDREYARKADARKGGVGAETQIVTAEVYGRVEQTKFIPVLSERGEGGAECLPAYLGSRMYFDLSGEDRYGAECERLERFLLKLPDLRRPPPGAPPPHDLADARTPSLTSAQFQRLEDAVERGKGHLAVIRRDYLLGPTDALAGFRLDPAKAAGAELDDQVVAAIARMRPDRDEFVEFALLFAGHTGDGEEAYADVHGFLERSLPLCEFSGSGGYYGFQFDAHRHVARVGALPPRRSPPPPAPRLRDAVHGRPERAATR